MRDENYRIIRQRIDELESIHGSGRAVSRAIDVDHVTLWRIKNNLTSPDDDTMNKMGLRWSVDHAQAMPL